jgi:hypothetical protein
MAARDGCSNDSGDSTDPDRRSARDKNLAGGVATHVRELSSARC